MHLAVGFYLLVCYGDSKIANAIAMVNGMTRNE